MSIVTADVTEAPLDVMSHLTAVEAARQGAVASFVGVVRDHDPEIGGSVIMLDYSAHPDAARILREAADRVVARYDADQVTRVAVTHRIGRLEVGEAAIVAAVSSPHRALAFTVCAELVDEVKRSVPIWKHQYNEAGDDVWSGLA